MLRKFSVTGFKNFKDEITLDLSQTKNYVFHGEMVQEGVVKIGTIFGKNSSGKSNLGLALFDVVNHLTDKENTLADVTPYINLNSDKNYVDFKYQFAFGENLVEYGYRKETPELLLEEELRMNGEQVLYYDYSSAEGVCKLKGAENLKIGLDTRRLSFVKYVYSNTVLPEDKNNNTFKQFIDYIDHMLMFHSLEGNRYFGFKQGQESLSDSIVRRKKLKDFQDFLNDLDIPCDLTSREVDGKYEIYNKFQNGESNFFRTASTGTKSLALFYYWLINSEEASFIYMDEFDAYYHYELSERVIEEILKERPHVQILFTSHNTNLMTNRLFRPDCLFIMQKNGIKSMAFLTEKELREAHNLQKMYKAGAFDE